MTRLLSRFLHILVLRAVQSVAYGLWCGKHYELGALNVPPAPESRFTSPPISPQPLLNFRCSTSSSIYIAGDLKDHPGIIIDAEVTNDVGQPYEGTLGQALNVIVSTKDIVLASGSVVPGTSGTVLPLDFSALSATGESYIVTCTAQAGVNIFTVETEAWYLPPNPYGGSTVKVDRHSGALMVEEEDRWEKIFPFGWYDPYLTNIERLDRAKRQGMNMIHPVPPVPHYAPNNDWTVTSTYMAHAEILGLGVMYDMRHSLTDLGSVKDQVERFRSSPSLLVWYTSDEPDGPPTSLDSTVDARSLIRDLDPYHPTALVLNCADYYFASYVQGTDILMLDVYSIAMNPIWSKKWSTPVNSTFGASGCDNCQGNFHDLSRRIDEAKARLRVMRREREIPVWIVPQAFDDHGDEFWWRVPTGDEEVVQTILAVNHGVIGHCAWFASSATPDLLGNVSFISKHLYEQRHFLLDNAHTRRPVLTSLPYHDGNGVDAFAWTSFTPHGTDILVLAAHLNYIGLEAKTTFSLQLSGQIKRVLFGDVRSTSNGDVVFRMGRTSTAGVILHIAKESDTTVDMDTGEMTLVKRLGKGSELMEL
ncbi:hypothetical protein M231_01538 [Tremella mesenterica]|uniref:Glycoside hydrolase family 2 catalytic domain-containing protein n=1 Tax=Tremella mesenterica TaxID=5217 RepID=A0A4Q1BSV8_TREME|nr:hypothetical protein M231_01538 [Tremella mesenterica]